MQLIPTGRLVNHVAQCFNAPILKGARSTFLAADAAAASGTITCRNITSTTIPIGIGDYLLIGEFGEETSEIIRVHTSTTPVNTTGVVTLNSNTIRAHTIDDPVYVIPYDQVQFFRADTTTITWQGTYSAGTAYVIGDVVLSSSVYYVAILAGTGQTPVSSPTYWRAALSGGVNIEPDSIYTPYLDVTNTTGQIFFRFIRSTASPVFYSAFSEAIPYSGETRRTISRLWDTVIGKRHVDRTKELEDFLLDQTNNFHDEVEGMRIWDFEVTAEDVTYTITTGLERYTLPSTIKRSNTDVAIESIHIGTEAPLIPYTWDEYLNDQIGRAKTALTAAVVTADTTINVTSTADFLDSGEINIGGDTIAYTAKTSTTLTGCTGIQAAGHSSGATVWQGVAFGQPKRFAIWNGEVYFDVPPSSTFSGKAIHIWFFRELAKVISPNDVLLMRFPYLLERYLEWQVEEWKGDPKGEAVKLQEQFERKLPRHASKEKIKVRRRLIPVDVNSIGQIR